MSCKNRYEHLKIDCLEDVTSVPPQSTWYVTHGRKETIAIYTTQLDDGLWVYGYQVYWASGKVSEQRPTAAPGKFRSQREASLYAIGFMLLYLDYFLAETREDIMSAEATLMQPELF
ncbi:MAG: hypothetical protein HDS52_07130 [Barnesiella sp.]|nr:hypothetical protein [Barnesiella sp.]